MDDIHTYSIRFSSMLNSFPDEIMERFKIIAGMDLKETIQLRIQQTGKTADGGEFKEYAEMTKRIRGSKGQQTRFKDFTDTGEMWRGFGVKNSSKSRSKLSVTMGGKTPDSVYKLNENTKREERNIIEPSKSEIAQVEALLLNEIDKFISTI